MPPSHRARRGVVFLAAAGLVASACSSTFGGGPEVVERPGWDAVFSADGLTGTMTLHEIGSDRIDVGDEARAEEPLTPASTFKILNSLIILETGVVPDVDTVLAWDGVDRGSEGWNRDQTLRTAIDVSAVWAYQAWAREVGEDRMDRWVDDAGYGNEDIGGRLDSFWLDGDLRISALEQVDFLTRFVEGELPFAERNQQAVREILVQDVGPGWSWSYKTGLSLRSEHEVGWLVGIVDLETSIWVFALNVDMTTTGGEPVDPAVRIRVAESILEAEGVLPER
ncbi:MAG: penicillin-binding transpeptidase domain-containing protein [Actinomycetota bacterium]